MATVVRRVALFFVAVVAATAFAVPAAWASSSGAVEKPDKPTCVKEVFDALSGEWRSETAATSGITVRFRVTCTMPKDILAFGEYPFVVVDELPDGLESVGEVTARLGQRELSAPGEFRAAMSGGDMVVTFTDLLAAGAEAGDVLEVEIPLKIADGGAHAGFADGYPNRAHAEYPDDPKDPEKKGKTPDSEAVVYTFSLTVEKHDAETKKPLAGAVFALQDPWGKVLCTDGTWVDSYDASKCAFETDADGKVSFAGLCSGEYRIVESEAPEGYALPEMGMLADVEVDVEAKELSATVAHELADMRLVDAASGEMSVSFGNEPEFSPSSPDSGKKSSDPKKPTDPFSGKSYGLPTTGDATVGLGIAGLVLAMLSAVGLAVSAVMRRRRYGR